MAGSVAVYRSRSRSRPNASNAWRLDRGVFTSQPVVHFGEILHTEIAPGRGWAAPGGSIYRHHRVGRSATRLPWNTRLDPLLRWPGLGAGRRRRLLQGPDHRTRHHRRAPRRRTARPRRTRRTSRRARPDRRATLLPTRSKPAFRTVFRPHRAHRQLPMGFGGASRAPSIAEPRHAPGARRTARTRPPG